MALLYAVNFSDPAIIDDFTGNNGTDILLGACGQTWACALSWLITINAFFAGVSSVAVTGRITYALARDGGFPFSEKIAEVSKTFKSPVNAISFVCFFDACIMLLPLNPNGGMTAFYSIIGLCVVGFQLSYGLPIFFKTVFPQPTFPMTPCSLGALSPYLGVVSWVWLFGTNVLYFLPTSATHNDDDAYLVDPITGNTTTTIIHTHFFSNDVPIDKQNWLFVVVLGTMFIAAVNWIFNSRFHFKGPMRHDEVNLLTPNVIELATMAANTTNSKEDSPSGVSTAIISPSHIE